MLNTVIQSLLVTSFLTCLSAHAYVVWSRRRPIAVGAGQAFQRLGTEPQRWTALFLAAFHSEKEGSTPGAGVLRNPAGTGKAATKNRLSMAGDWLAPIIVWILVILMGLAIVGFLLGER
jgi:hypothetical protein